MKLTSLLSLGLAASPAVAELGQVLLCTGANQTGTCDLVHAQIPSTGSEGKCFSLANTAFGGKNGTLGTFAPDGEHFGCYARYIPCGGICRAASGCSVTQKPITFDWAYKYTVPAGIQSFGCFLLHPSEGGDSKPTATTTAGGAKPSNTCACAPVSTNTCACDSSKGHDGQIQKRGRKGKKVKASRTKTTTSATATARMGLWTDERDGD